MPVLPRVLAAVGVLALGLGGALVVAAPAAAASITVSNVVDDGLAGSLSYALSNYTAGDTIDITTPGPIVASAAGLPTIFNDVTIVGPVGGTSIVMAAAGGSFNVSGAAFALEGVDLVSDTPGSGQGISMFDGDLTLTDVSVRDFDVGLFYIDSVGGHTVDLTDVDAGGGVIPATLGIAIQSITGMVSLTRVAVSFTNGGGIVIGTGGGTVDLDTVSAEDGSGLLVQTTNATVTADHISTARTLDGVTFQVDSTQLDLTDLTLVDTADLGADIEAVNGSVVTVTTADVSSSDSSGISFGATDSTITATGITAHDNGLVPGCGCGGDGSGIELYADNSTVSLTGANSHDNTATSGGGIYVGEAENAATVIVSDATVTDNTAHFGAGIDVAQAFGASTLTISDSTVSHNHANISGTDDGGGIGVDQFADDGTSLTISDSTVSDNESADFGAGIYLHEIGAGVQSTAHVTIVRTTIDHNTAQGYGAGIAITDPAEETTGQPTVLIDSSTISNNTSPAGGGGIHVRTSLAGVTPAIVKLLNATISGNDAQAGGGVDVSGGGAPGTPAVTMVVSHSTIAGNSAHTSGGVAASPESLAVDNSIIAGSTSNNGNTPNDLDVGGSVIVTYSLVQTPDAGVVVSPADGNITGVDPQLAPLANNGGRTKTMLIAPGSPAYNTGDLAFTGAGLLDQRGQARVFQIVDMGAVEWHPALALTGGGPQPEVPLWGMLFLFIGLALVAASRIRQPV